MIHRTITCCILTLIATVTNATDPPLTWKVVPLAIDANEGIDVADFNGDGRLDVAAGRFWYQNPGFRPRPLRHFEDVNGYVESNGDFAYDVDDDGVMDIIAGGFFATEVNWYKNPGAEGLRLGHQWEQRLLLDTEPPKFLADQSFCICTSQFLSTSQNENVIPSLLEKR